MQIFRIMAAAAAIAGATAIAGAPAQAAIFNFVDGTAGAIPDAHQTNEVVAGLGLGAPLAGFFEAQINLVGSSPVLVEFLGYEAGYRNTFTLGGDGFHTETTTLPRATTRRSLPRPRPTGPARSPACSPSSSRPAAAARPPRSRTAATRRMQARVRPTSTSSPASSARPRRRAAAR